MVGDGDLVLDRNAGSSTLGTTRPDQHSWNATGGGSSVTSNIALSEWGRYLGDAT